MLAEAVEATLAKMTPILKVAGVGRILMDQPQIVRPLVENLVAEMEAKAVQVLKMLELLAVFPVAAAAVHQVAVVVGPQVEQVAVVRSEYGCINGCIK